MEPSSTHLPDFEVEHLSPPIPTLGVEKVYPGAAAGPAPSFEVASIRFLDEYVKVLGVRVNPERVGPLDMRVNDSNHLFSQLAFVQDGVEGKHTFRPLEATASSIAGGLGKCFLSQSKYLCSSAYSMSSHVTSRGISASSNFASTSSTSS